MGITLSLHSVFNDLFFRDFALCWKLTWCFSKLLSSYVFLATLEHFVSFCHVYCLSSVVVLYNYYYYLDVCIASLDVTVPVTVVSVIAR